MLDDGRTTTPSASSVLIVLSETDLDSYEITSHCAAKSLMLGKSFCSAPSSSTRIPNSLAGATAIRERFPAPMIPTVGKGLLTALSLDQCDHLV